MQKVVMWISILAVIAFAILNLAYTGPEPDAVYPMVNRGIEWTYAGK